MRNEALNARNFFQTTNPDKPEFRRQQFGGTLGGPIVEESHVLLRGLSGAAAEHRADRVRHRADAAAAPGHLHRGRRRTRAGIYDPATSRARRRTARRFAGNTIPIERMDPVALDAAAALSDADDIRDGQQLPAGPTNEVDNQDQLDVRIDHRFAHESRSGVRAAVEFPGRFCRSRRFPTAAACTTGALGPQDTNAWSFASNYQHTFSSQRPERVPRSATRARTCRRGPPPSSRRPPGPRSAFPAFRRRRSFRTRCRLFNIAGYTAARIAGQHRVRLQHQRDRSRRLADLVQGTPHASSSGFDWRWERLNVIQPPSPTGHVHVHQRLHRPAGPEQHDGQRAGELPARSGRHVRDRPAEQLIQERAHFLEFFVQDDWKVTDRFTVNAGLRYTLNFPSTEVNNQMSVFNLQTQQIEYAGGTDSGGRARTARRTTSVRGWASSHASPTRPSSARGYGLIWIEMAGITTPFTTPTFPVPADTSPADARQRHAGVRAARRARASRRSARRRTRASARACSQSIVTLGSGYVQQWNVSMQRELTTNTRSKSRTSARRSPTSASPTRTSTS